jgi:DNA-binding beta-propeller fold protein YncE
LTPERASKKNRLSAAGPGLQFAYDSYASDAPESLGLFRQLSVRAVANRDREHFSAPGLRALPLEEWEMKKVFAICVLTILALSIVVFAGVHPQEPANMPLRLLQTIPMPGVKGRLDHLDVDVKGQRLFVSGLENGSVEVVDLQAGKWLLRIPGFNKPQGIAYVRALNKIFIASGDDGMVRVFRGDTLALLDSIQLALGPNRVAYDPGRKLLYVGYGGKDAGKDYGEVGIIDATQDTKVADVQVAAHPAELLLNQLGDTLFVLIPAASKIQMIDTKERKVVSAWPVSSQRPGDAAFDEPAKRLFLGTHLPPQMIAMDSTTGKEVASLPTMEGMDGVYFDSKLRRIYVSGGRGFDVGFVYVYQQQDPDHYTQIGTIPTRPGAGTSFWSSELDRYYLAAPGKDRDDAAILVYEPRP